MPKEKQKKYKVGFFDKMINRISPSWALKRTIAKTRIERFHNVRKVEALSGGRKRFSFGSTSLNIDSEVYENIVEAREQIRQYELENGNVSGPFLRIKKNVVGGNGIRLNPDITADDSNRREFPIINEKEADYANYQVQKYFDIWNRKADKRLILPFYGSNGIQGIVEHALLRDNEVLVIGRTSNRKDRIIPYCLEVLETDRLNTPPGEIGNPRVNNGIRYDEEGAQEAFYVLKEHPGNQLTAVFRDQDYEEIPAYNDNGTKKVMFLFNPIRPEQTRAFSKLLSALKDIQDADRIMEAEKMAELEDSCLFGTVTTDDPTGWDNDNTDSGEKEYDRIHEFAPNEVKYLFPGEKFEAHRSMRPNSQFEPFLNQIWRGPANAFDVPPEVFMQVWGGMNYSNARTVLLQFYSTCRERQKFLIDNLCIPVYENVFRWFVIKGLVQASSFYRREYDWLNHSWIAPGWQWVDPSKEADGKETECRLGTDNIFDIMLSQGKNPETQIEKIARGKKFIKEMEKKYDVELFPKDEKPVVKPASKDDEE